MKTLQEALPIILLVLIMALAGCTTDAATGRRQLSPLTQDALDRLGRVAVTALEARLAGEIAGGRRVIPQK